MEQFLFYRKTCNGFLKKFWLFVFLTFFSLSVKAQCPTGEIILGSQEVVDNFTTYFPNCTEITGNLTIGYMVNNLNGLSHLTSVGGNLWIPNNQNLTNLEGLNNLQTVGGYLQINGSLSLNNLNGLSNLTSVGGNVWLFQNSNLTSLDGLSNLTSIGTFLNINSNQNLTNLDGLSNLTSIGNYLNISYNPNLTNLDGLSNLTSIGGDLLIQSNSSLTDISGLQNIDPASIFYTFFGGLSITNNSLLSVCNLDNFCTYLQGSRPRTISGNADDCVSVTAVNAACSPAPPCDAPANLTVSGIINNKATINWTNSGTFDLKWGAENFTEGNELGTANGISVLNYEITGLTANTAYDVYVRQNCTANQSSWVKHTFSTIAQCPSGYVELFLQADVDNFAINYPNCTEIQGYLGIAYSNITNLDGLSALESVGGHLSISNSNLTNLDGLSALTSVGGYLNIQNNSSLTTLDGLSALTSVGGYLNIQNNSSLTTLDGLSALTSVGGYLNFHNNAVLEHVNDLSNLTTIGGFLQFWENPQLQNLNGLSNLTAINGDLIIEDNYILNDITELSNIVSTSITPMEGWGLYIKSNPALAVCNLPNFCAYLANDPSTHPRTISENLAECLNEQAVLASCIPACDVPANLSVSGIINNKATINWTNSGTFDLEWGTAGFTQGTGTTQNGVSALNYEITGLSASTSYDVYVRKNCTANQSAWVKITFSTIAQCPTGDVSLTSQADVDNFAINYPNCTEIQGYLYITGSGITNLNGLSALTSVGEFLNISANSQLTNLNGLSALTTVGGFLSIGYHNALTDISGLSNIDPATITNLYIIDNPNLSTCNIDAFCTYLQGSGPRTIYGNATGCEDENTILANCPITALPCDVPANLTVSGIINNKATINWTNSGTFDLKWGAENFTDGNELGTANGISALNYEITGLSASTSYDVYVSQNCGDNQSDWVKVTFSTIAQCPSGDVTFSSQADVDNFAIYYPNCTEIQGYLLIHQGSDITNLNGLSALESIGGDLYIYNNYQLTNLDGLSNLTQIGGDLSISSNSQLTNLDGLSNLTQIGGYLYIVNNSQLTNLDGLSNLTQIGGYLGIQSNAILENLDGLSNLTEIGGYLNIQSNSQLTNLDGLSNLTEIGGYLNIQSNSQLTNLDGLSALESINGDLVIYTNAVLTDISGLQNIDPATISTNYGLRIQNNPLLSVCNLPNFCTYLAGSGLRTISNNAGDCVSVTAVTTACTTSQEPQCPTGVVTLYSQADVNNFATNYPNCTEITGFLYISGSTITDLSPLSNIQSVGGYLEIYNSQLTNLDGLSNLTQIGGYLEISSNSQLTNLDGLSSLTSVGGYLEIYYNSNLTNLDGLSNLTSVGADLVINSNYSLTDISGLQNIDPNSILSSYFGLGLYIKSNSSLSVCNLDNFCTYLAGSGLRTISGNAGDCISVAAVNAACTPACDVPTNLSTSNVTSVSAKLKWTSTGDNFDIEWGVAGFTPGSGTTVTDITTNSYDLTNLDYATQYQFYVLKNCTVNQSDWVGPFSFTTLSQCPSGDVYLNFQAEVDAFAINYPNCTELSGNLTIQGANITDLTPLSNLTSVGGYLNIYYNSNLTNLDGLSNLTSVGGYLHINSNSNLTNLDGLSNLTSVGGNLDIYDNLSLTNLDGLSHLTSVGGYLNINYNSNLTNLDGLSNLTSVGRYLYINSNSNLTNLDGLSNLTSVGADLVINSNYSLTDISGLQNIDPNSILSSYFGIGLYITDNPLLSVCNLDNFCTYLAGSGPRTISGNAGDCISEAAVNAACNPVCDAPNALTATATSVSATLGWTSTGDNFDIEWGVAGFTPGSGTLITDITTNSYNLTSLSSNTQYQFYVRQDCTLNESDWVGPFAFTTQLQCPTGDINLNSQAQVDAFAVNYPNCTEILGDLIIQGNDISDLSVLSNLAGVNGDLRIQNTQLTNLHGLHNLSNLEGDLYVYQNDELISLLGSSNLTSIQGDLYINENSLLENLSGLSNIIQISGGITITNTSLVNLNDLSSLTSMGGNLLISFNTELENLNGLNNLTTIGGYLDISYNSVLENLNGLSGLTTIEGGEFYIEANAQLTNIVGLHNLNFSNIQLVYIVSNSNLSVCHIDNLCIYLSGSDTRIISGNTGDCEDESALSLACGSPIVIGCPDGDIVLLSQAQIDQFIIDYPYCTEIEGNLIIGDDWDITIITDLSALSNITSIEGNLKIVNTQLTSLEGLSSLTTIGGDIQILENWELVSLFDHELISFDGYLDILSASMLESLSGFANTTTLSGLSLDYTALVNLEDLSNLTAIGSEGLYFAYNIFTDFSGLNNLTTIDGNVYIANNYELVTFEGLNNLTSIVGTLNINWNTALSDISALANIDYTTIEYLEIFYNSELSECSLPSFCAYFTNSGQGYIEDNASDCMSIEDIQDACAEMGACNLTTTWNGTSWSNGEPTITTKAIIDGALILTSDLTACELEVTENGSLVIPTGRSFTVKGQVINNSSSDDFVIESNGILLQIDNVENQGAITVERESSPMYRLDYTIWSSPVSGMLLRDFSDVSISGGSGTLWNRVYTLGDNVWNQVWATQQAFESDNTTTFGQAKGYMYRAKNAWVTRNSGNPAEADLGVFTGVPNNGTISINTPLMFNAIGNPYPSPVNAESFLNQNPGILYFWTNVNAAVDGSYEGINNWVYYVAGMGGTGVNGQFTPADDMHLQPGQGFVLGTDQTNISFNNTMRVNNNGMFFRQMSNERHRFWLNLSNEEVMYNQILVGYMENATQDVDAGIDAKMFAYEGNAIYSIIDNNEEKFVIQGRSLPFTDADVVKLGFRAIESGSFSISLNNFDGIFEQENLIIYLKDNFNQTQHNLKNGAYSFVSEEGFFENRFEVVYQTTMSTDNPISTDATWIVYKQDKGFQVQTIGFEMKEVEVYDILGRAVYTSKAEGTTHHIPVLGAEGVFIVKVKTTEDKVLNKKVR